VGVAAIACGTSDGDGDSSSADVTANANAFDVNDVSILFPLGPDGMPDPNVRVDADGTPLFGPGTFKTVTEFARSGSEGFKDPDTETNEEIVGQKPHVHIEDGALDRKNWRVVGMRFDPCAPGGLPLAFSDPRCLVELRLVAQPFVDGKPQDVAAHLVFNLGVALTSPGLITSAVTDLQQIKARSSVPTTGEPLGVHPGLEAEASSGKHELGDLVAAFITKYAAKAQDIRLLGNTLTTARVTAFMVKDGDFTQPADAPEWYFMVGNITNDTWTPSEITPVGAGVHFEKVSFKQKQPGEGDFAPVVDGKPAAVSGHFLPAFKPANASSEPLFQGDTDPRKIQAVEDPTKSTVLKVDCGSCHTSTSRTIALDAPAAARLPSPPGITAVVRRENLQSSVANVRNFGYFATKPTVSMRTLNETVAVADFLDRRFISGRGASPVAVDDKIWTCCMKGGGPECDGTVCASSDKARRKVSLEPNDHGGNPCSPDTSAAENDPRSLVEVSADGKSATLHGNNAACLGLSMNGNFFSDSVDIQCSELDLCTITSKQPITGDTARRLRNILYLSEQGGGFVAKDANHEVDIACDDTCSVTFK
jgi:hypothetical protein